MPKTVLVVDYNQGSLDAYEILFKDHVGYNLITTNNPLVALKINEDILSKGQSIDLLITDLVLEVPGLNGRSLIEKMHEISPQTKFMLCTYYDKEDMMYVLNLLKRKGIEAEYLSKDSLCELTEKVKSRIGE